MNKEQNDWRHVQLNEDMEWSGKVLSFKKEIREMLFLLDEKSIWNTDVHILDQIRCTREQLTAQLNNLEEIAHIARSNEFALLARVNMDAEAARRYRNASRIKEQSLLQFFAQQFEKVREEYNRLCSSLFARQSISA